MGDTRAGYIDGCLAGEVYGWAGDLETPRERLMLDVYVDGEPVGQVATRHFRPDAGSAIGGTGMHGFHFDLRRLKGRSGEVAVDVRFAGGKQLGGSPIRVQIPEAYEPERPGGKPMVVFLHLLKTAGTALRNTLLDSFRPSEVSLLYPDPPGINWWDLREIPEEERGGVRLAFGHIPYGVHQYFPQPYTYATLVRNPIPRMISYYQHMRRARMAHVYDGERLMRLEEVLEALSVPHLDNYLVRSFAGLDDVPYPAGSIGQAEYDLALENARTQFSFIGFQEYYDQDVPLMFDFYGWRKPDGDWAHARANEGNYRQDLDERASQIKAIEHFDRWDMKLYAQLLQDKADHRRRARFTPAPSR